MRYVALCAALALVSPALAVSNARLINGPLRFEAAHQRDANLRARLQRWLEEPETISTDADRGRWIATDGEVVMVNGSVYHHRLGDRPWVVLTPDGQWAAGGSAGVLANGNFFPGDTLSSAMRQQLINALPQAAAVLPAPVPAPAPSVRSVAPSEVRVAVVDDRLDVPVVIDKTPPTVDRADLVLPGNRVVPLGTPNVFVGAQSVTIRLTMSEKMATAPKVRVQQPGFNALDLPLQSNTPTVFEYAFFPVTAAANNGPVKIEISGGTDEAGNPIQAGSPNTVFDKGLGVDTVPPDLLRIDLSQPGNFRTQPKENAVLPKNGFPKEILVLARDYNTPDDGTFAGENVATDQASGIDFDQAGLPGSNVQVKLFDPRGTEIKGVLAALAPSGFRLLLPDVYDPANGVFPDTDSDGVADPIEGTYRIQVDLTDKAGNSTSQTLPFGEDTTPLPATAVAVSIRPVFSTPFPNPANPIGATGTAVKKLDRVEVTSADPMWDVAKSNAELLSTVVNGSPKPVKVTVTREGKTIILTVDPDQDGNGQPDWENPAPGQFLPPGTVDPRFGRNDGVYIIRVHARDTAGNQSTIEREILLDTTAPDKPTSTFPTNAQKIAGDLRIVDATLTDPKAASGRDGSGIQLEFSQINLRFLGNQTTPAQFIRGIVFVHKPNDSDPTQPDFNPNDHFPKILYQIVNTHNDSISLPRDGSFDGVYELKVQVRDRAGNEASGITSFEYSGKTTSTTGTTSVVNIHQLVPLRAPVRAF